jgi:cell division protein FtsI (penicillin-binding protein 3)
LSRFSPARLKLVRLGLTGAFALVAARSAQLALAPDPRLARLGERQYSSPVELAPKRGRVYDRRGNVLAQSVEVESLYAEPKRFQQLSPEKRRAGIVRLAKALGLPERQIAERLDSSRGFVWLARRVEPAVASAVAALDLEGIGSVKESKRFYPNVELAGHVLGFSGVDSEGLEGLEREYDSVLKSQAKRFERPRDARGRGYLPGDGFFVAAEDSGQELILTLDQQIQYLAEAALRKGVLNSKARGGFVIVQDPRTGEILAMAGQPTYNPNAFGKHRPEEWRNRAVTDVFEPGSTIKPVLIAAALESGAVKPHDIFFCENGSLDVADVTIRDSKRDGWGWLDIPKILAVSSNIGMIKIGRLLGKDAYYDALYSFGFGAKSGIDLPGEATGLIPARKRWSSVTLASASFGHNVGVTGLQLTSAISAIANGGTLMRPYVVRRLMGPGGQVIHDVAPVEVRQSVSPATAAKVASMMEKVVSSEGTGIRAAIPDYRVAGKTGTTQKVDPISGGYGDARIASFVGFVPASKPRLTILVVIDEPKTSVYGGEIAAPIFQEIAEGSLRYMTVPADGSGRPISEEISGDHVGEGSLASRLLPSQSAALDAKLAAVKKIAAERAATAMSRPVTMTAEDAPEGVVPDFAGLSIRGALRVAEPRRLELDVKGTGRALRQEPEPGTKAEPGAKVTIWFEGRGA